MGWREKVSAFQTERRDLTEKW